MNVSTQAVETLWINLLMYLRIGRIIVEQIARKNTINCTGPGAKVERLILALLGIARNMSEPTGYTSAVK
jgi:hypothetical protein